MQISKITARLSGEDIISILNDFVKVDGLTFENIIVGDNIEVKGNFKKLINIKFKANLEILGVHNNIISLNIKSIKLKKLGILRFIKNIALKMALKDFNSKGISSEKDIIKVEVDKVLKMVPFLKIIVSNLCLENGFILTEVDSAVIDIARIGEKPEEIIEESTEEKIEEVDIALLDVEKVKDAYSDTRDKVEEKLPKKLRKYSDYIFILPDVVALLYRLLKDSRVPKKTKISLLSSLAYVTLPFDILPDKIPFVGSIDDLGAIFFAVNRIIEDVPITVILENWQGKNEFIDVLRSSAEYLTKYSKAGNIEKVYSIINQLVEA